MKRATKAEVQRRIRNSLYTSERRVYEDILDSDARQAATIRRLRADVKRKDAALQDFIDAKPAKVRR